MMGLMTIDEAARELRVPRASLRKAAEKHGMLVRMEKTLRIDPNCIQELLEKCRDAPKDPASTGTRNASCGFLRT